MVASASVGKTIYLGPFAHCVSLTDLEICAEGVIGVDEEGVIRFVEREVGLAQVQEKHVDWKDAKVVRVEDGFFFPGFIGKWPSKLRNELSSRRHMLFECLRCAAASLQFNHVDGILSPQFHTSLQ